MKKKILSFLLCGLCSLTLAFAPAMVSAEVPQMTKEEFPVIDGSLACVPMITALTQLSTGCTEAEAEDFPFTNTNPSYLSLAEGERDLILAYEPSSQTKRKLKKKYEDVELEMTEIGNDALVFLINAANPVKSLTTEQLKDIFTGKITNWKEVGGDDAEIIVFIRPENSGSHTLLRKLIIGKEDTAQAQVINVETMEGMIEQMKSYDNAKYSIGYSVYYYTAKMMADENVEVMQVDGVTPSDSTIKSGDYQLCNPFYCVTTEASAESAKSLRDWLTSDEGQEFVESCGYVGFTKK